MSVHAATVLPARITAAVLAGGESSRFGSDKALATVPGTKITFLARVIGAAESVAGDVIIVAPDRPAYARHSARLVIDRFPGQGPAGGTVTALNTTGSKYLVILSCDQPMIIDSDLRVLLGTLALAPAAAYSRDVDAIHPFPCAFNVSRCRAIANQVFDAGARSMTELLRRCGAVAVDFPGAAHERSRLRDIDTPEDFQNVEDQLRHGPVR
jgi:molybdopterin-guanine dinucleotide biosynthesis protein A